MRQSFLFRLLAFCAPSLFLSIVPPGGGKAGAESDWEDKDDAEFSDDVLRALGVPVKAKEEPAKKDEGGDDEADEAAPGDQAVSEGDEGASDEPEAGDGEGSEVVDPRDAEIADLKAKLAAKGAGDAQEEEKSEPVKVELFPVTVAKDEAALNQRAAALAADLKVVSRHLDGYTTKDEKGGDIEISAEMVRERFAQIQEELLVSIPAEREVLRARAKAEAVARRDYPEHFSAGPTGTAVRDLFAEIPGLDRHPDAHRIAAEILEGRKATRKTPVKAGDARAPVKAGDGKAVVPAKKAEPTVVPTGRGGAFAPAAKVGAAKRGMTTEEFQKRGAGVRALRDILFDEVIR